MSQPSYDQKSQNVHNQQNAIGDIHNYNHADALEEMAIYEESSRRAKLLSTLGILLIIGGFAIFGASFFVSASTGFNPIPSLPTEELAEWARQQMNQDAASAAQSFQIAMIGFGTFVLGIIVAAWGSWQARKDAYRRRLAAGNRRPNY